jgi:transcriptional regulator with XRE-family HTH domain
MTLEKRGVEGLTVEKREIEKPEVLKAGEQNSRLSRSLTNSRHLPSRSTAAQAGVKQQRHDEAVGGQKHTPKVEQRVRDLALHISWYGFKTQARLAQDSGVSPAAISRLIRGQSQPSLALALRVTAALSRRAGRDLDVREVFSLDGSYPTPTCALMGCRACLPTEAYDEDDNLKPSYQKPNYRKPSDRIVPNSSQREGGA